jgi:hypothetical protein
MGPTVAWQQDELADRASVIALQITGPSSRQRGRPTWTNPQLSKKIKREGEKLVADSRWVPDTKRDWPPDCRS